MPSPMGVKIMDDRRIKGGTRKSPRYAHDLTEAVAVERDIT